MDKELSNRLAVDRTVQKLEKKIRNGKGTMKDAADLGGAAGRVAAKLIAERLKEEFPNGQIPEDDVRRIISPIRRQRHSFVTEMTAIIIDQKYQDAGIGMKAILQEYDVEQENERVKEISPRSYVDGFY